MDNKCPICHGEGSKVCTGCRLVNYCSADHQKQHWKQHKKICSPFQVKHSDELQRYLVASRDLKARTVIISEVPMGVGPGEHEVHLLKKMGDDGNVTEESSKSLPVCLGCCALMTTSPEVKCSKCGWPVCGEECSGIGHHAENECQLFVSSGAQFNLDNMEFMEKSIMVLRLLLLRSTRPKLWEKLGEMEHHNEIRGLRETSVMVDNGVIQNLKRWTPPDFSVDEDEVRRLNGIIVVNSFSLEKTCEKSLEDLYKTKRLITTKVRCLFKDTTILAHSCVPNCRWSISASPQFRMIIRTSIPIKKGELLTIPYGSKELFVGTLRRRETIKDEGLFECRCPRCLDPTEMGTNLSGIKCQDVQCGGYLLPQNPVDPTSIWTCRDCGHVKNAQDVSRVICQLEKEVSSMAELMEGGMSGVSVEKRVKTLEEMIRRCSGSLLHPNHYLLQRASRAIFNIFSKHCDIPELEDEPRSVFLKHCQALLDVADKITPGCTLSRANLQYHMSGCWMRMGLKSLRAIHEDHAKVLDSLTLFRRTYEFQTQALDFFQDAENGKEYVDELTSLKGKSKEVVDKLESLASVALFR